MCDFGVSVLRCSISLLTLQRVVHMPSFLSRCNLLFSFQIIVSGQSWEVHQSQKSTALTLAVEMSALMGGIQFVFLSVLLLLEMYKKPAERVWVNVKRKCCRKQKNEGSEEDPDVEGGAANDEANESTDEDNDEFQPLLPVVAEGGGRDAARERTTARVTVLEAIVSDLSFRHRDHDVLHTKVRGNSATLRALCHGGNAKMAVEDSIDASWSLDEIIVTCTSDDEDEDELRRIAVGTFALVMSHARHPTWQRTVGDDVIQIYHRRRRWHIGVQGEQALARSATKADDASPIEVDWEVRSANDDTAAGAGGVAGAAPAGAWRSFDALSLNVPASADFMSRLKGIFSRGAPPSRVAPRAVPAVEMVRAPRRVDRPAPEIHHEQQVNPMTIREDAVGGASATSASASSSGVQKEKRKLTVAEKKSLRSSRRDKRRSRIDKRRSERLALTDDSSQVLGASTDHRAGGGGGGAVPILRDDVVAAIGNPMHRPRVPAAAAAEANDPSEAAAVHPRR